MIKSPVLALVFLVGSTFITAITYAVQRIGKTQSELLAKHQGGLARLLFTPSKRDLLSYSLTINKNIFLICYTITAFDFIFHLVRVQTTPQIFILAALSVLGCSVIGDYLMRALSLFRPNQVFKCLCQPVSLFLLPCWPFAWSCFKVLQWIFSKEARPEQNSFGIKDKILEILHDSEFAPYIDPQDHKLILSVISFKERIAREVMVPRIDMFTLSTQTSVSEAAHHFLKEGYSRIPVWKENVDNIVGTLYYKDLLNIYLTSKSNNHEALSSSIESLLKPIVYSPETKKISHLLQEFRLKQIHLAIVVDEYGGTEGMITIEDILEQLVGDIADEYDHDEQALFSVLPSGGWVVDAKMTILDIESELNIKIPQSPEYDTIGGYIFQKIGTIPSKGWRFHHDDFELEVLSSSERSLEKIRITPL